MRLIAKIFVALGLLLLFLSNCMRKKTPAASLSGWLEEHFPGRFQIVSTHISDPVRHLSFQVKRSVVAERNRPLVQAVFSWDKREPGLGMSTGAVDSAFIRAARELEDAQALYSALKNVGFERVSAGIHQGVAQVVIFEEPTPEHRRNSLAELNAAFEQWPSHGAYDLCAAYMEPAEYGVHFQDIAPLDYWEQPGSFHLRRVLFSLNHRRQPSRFDAGELEGEWQLNTYSDDFGKSSGQARNRAEEWGAKHLVSACRLLPTSEILQDERHSARIIFRFPYSLQPAGVDSASTEENIDGYLSVRYDADLRSFSSIKNSKN